MFPSILLLFLSFSSIVLGRGYSLPSRMFDSPISDENSCRKPNFITEIPEEYRKKIDQIWMKYRKGDCWIELARTRNVIQQLLLERKNKEKKRECKIPEIVYTLPHKMQKRIEDIWKNRNKNGDCKEQQKKTRLILLNLPASLRFLLHPPSFQCSLPHFYNRLEPRLQKELLSIWSGYKEGEPCTERVDRELSLLEQNDISLESFRMPPERSFRREEVWRKIMRASTA